jgi:hypothetical protein
MDVTTVAGGPAAQFQLVVKQLLEHPWEIVVDFSK